MNILFALFLHFKILRIQNAKCFPKQIILTIKILITTFDKIMRQMSDETSTVLSAIKFNQLFQRD